MEIIALFDWLDDQIWTYLASPLIIMLGVALTYRYKAAQLRRSKRISPLLMECYTCPDSGTRGISPLYAFYMTIGGCIGVANIVAVCTAVRLGGPGALFWMWVAAFFGMLVKYAEIYLGVKFRIANQEGSYDGGPIYYFKKVFSSPFPSVLFAMMLAIYGTEVYMFKVVSDSFIINWHLPNYVVIPTLLGLVLLAVTGGGSRVGKICGVMMPAFIGVYCFMGLWVLGNHITMLPSMLFMVVKSAFTGHAAVGGFAGSSMMVAMSQGMKRACYTADIGVGYAGVVCAETQDSDPTKQADLSILGVFLDTFVVCTMSVLLVLVTGVWTQGLPESEWVLTALGLYFPYMNIFMPIFIFLLGYSTIISYFHVGRKCLVYLLPNIGGKLYYVYAMAAFVVFSFVEQSHAILLMQFCGAIMLLLNLYAIVRLHGEIQID
ncbi:amino acid carrier protein [Candidatus Synchoanobacter obligatus]|uniref:Amino acid carrier protein n=1 Tax=Candidatus Synchoanobacter obligatus TaxID=2919597 RepID=A0ABT1L3R5_9GAMM|nr:amino acid carrier protein [Candidatus Synchoanobacter obligatus]MCP8351847.1 amino acid carrier protein [Candidatus Synchoanobacter obligatus]